MLFQTDGKYIEYCDNKQKNMKRITKMDRNDGIDNLFINKTESIIYSA